MPGWLLVTIVCLFAGFGAGVGTGLAGLSAAAVISPMLIVCLGMDPYMAVGIALASDVLASGASAITYGRNKNIDIKNGIFMLIAVLAFTFVGSLVAKHVPSTTMGNFSLYMTLFLGLKFIFKPVMVTKEGAKEKDKKIKIIESLAIGVLIGFVCGFVGAGGGMMLLLALTTILGYDLKTAVGTSVFIMSFTALTGAISHFAMGGTPDILVLVLCMIFTLLFAKLSSLFANKAEPKVLNRVTGIVLSVLGVVLIIINWIG